MKTFKFPMAALCCLLLTSLAHAVAKNHPSVLAVETIDTPLPFLAGNLLLPGPNPNPPPLRVLLSRERYWAQDGHLDLVVELAAGETPPTGMLRVKFLGADGRELDNFELQPPSERFLVVAALPAELLDGGRAAVEVSWADGGELPAQERLEFRVEQFPEAAGRAGQVAIHIANPDAVRGSNIPFTLGVPFPRGTLQDATNLRLVDETGREIPLQALETARWSQFGSIKWVRCDFSADLDGGPREFRLEYGPETTRAGDAPLRAVPDRKDPLAVDAGRLRLANGLSYDLTGDGKFVRVLAPGFLAGGFVTRRDGPTYTMPASQPWEIEESGPRKLVLAQRGWFQADGMQFCQYVTRWILHRDSPLIRIFHTWIYTGDSNLEADHIRNMGWRLPLAAGVAGSGFLSSAGDGARWIDGDSLVQYRPDRFAIRNAAWRFPWARSLAPGGTFDWLGRLLRPFGGAGLFERDLGAAAAEFEGDRAPGVARMDGRGFQLYFGAKDFWQNYPSELEFGDGALTFFNWPAHNLPANPADRTLETDDPEAALKILQARFAHQGETLDLRLPQALRAPIDEEKAKSGGAGGVGENPNAQGISRTEEMWLLVSADGGNQDNARRLLESLDRRRLIATADPAWIAASGALFEIHPHDPEAFPEIEATFEQVALAPSRWADRLGIYGMWIYGDVPAWIPALETRQPALYRAYRKAHHAWPYPWDLFARSGDSRYLEWAEASTRQMIDANHCHYHTEEVYPDGSVGVWNVSPLPWDSDATEGRGPHLFSIHNKVDYLWNAYYLTGFHRARDLALLWQQAAKENAGKMETIGGGIGFRTPTNLMKTFLDTFEATFDPWFLVGAHEIARRHQQRHQTEGYKGEGFYGHYSGDREFLRFTGSQAHRDYYLDYAGIYGADSGFVALEGNSYAYTLTGDQRFLDPLAALLDHSRLLVFEGESPDYLRGTFVTGSTSTAINTCFSLKYFPFALAAMAKSGGQPALPPAQFDVSLPATVLVKKTGPVPVELELTNVPPKRFRLWGDGRAAFQIKRPDGSEALAGAWDIQQQQSGETVAPLEVPIAAAEPDGIYAIEFQPDPAPHWARAVVLPIAGRDVPEVLRVESGQPVGGGQHAYLWFLVPEGVEKFTVRFQTEGPDYRLFSIWNPAGRRVWSLSYSKDTDPELGSAEIQVPKDQAGKLWRVVLPMGGRFVMDPQIPPFYSVTPEKWFDPTAS